MSGGAAVDTADNDGYTALMLATGFGHFQAAEVRSLI